MFRRPFTPPLTDVAKLVPAALVLPRLKILYFPVTKAACTTLKWALAEAEGSLSHEAADALPTAAVTRTHTIHNIKVSGFRLFRELSVSEQQHVLHAEDWWRVGAFRNPYARLYSSWENRILLRAPSQEIPTFADFDDVLVDGCIDIVATFERFVHTITDKPHLVHFDDHFRSQAEQIRPGEFPHTHLLQVDKPGELDNFIAQVNERAGTNVSLQRLNEGLHISYTKVVTSAIAPLIEKWGYLDFALFPYPTETFPDAQPSIVLTPNETKMIMYAREVTERLSVAAAEVRNRIGARYGLSEILRRTRQWRDGDYHSSRP